MQTQRSWKRFLGVAGTLSLLVLAACGGQETSEEEGGDTTKELPPTTETAPGVTAPRLVDNVFMTEDFNPVKTNVGEPIEGGNLNFGLVASSPFAGVLHGLWGRTTPDAEVRQFFEESIFQVDENFIMNQEGAATWEVCDEGRIFTFTIRDNVYWSDGEPVTAYDWIFTHEVLASPDYTGIRFTPTIQTIEGIMDFHNGDADTISGLRALDSRTLEMEFTESNPALLNGAIWGTLLPKHLFEDIPVADMETHALVRETPIGFGPFILETLNPGESAIFVRNENYWRGRPNLDTVTLRTVHSDVLAAELRAGNLDVVTAFPASQVIDHVDMNNVEWLGFPNLGYSYIGFKLGYFDEETGEHVTVPDMKMSDVNLRRAMWHALDTQGIGENILNGLQWAAAGIIPPGHAAFYGGFERPEFNPELAKQILDEAGFIDVTGDGYRENPDGEELVINFFVQGGGSPASQAINLFQAQSWREVGLNIEMHEVEFNAWVDMVNNDHPDVDVFAGAWSLGWNPDPYSFFGRTGGFNHYRFTSPVVDRLLEQGNSPEAFDLEFRQQTYLELQEYILENVPLIPTLYSINVRPTNNRVLNFAPQAHAHNLWWYNVALSAEEGIAHQ